MYKKNLQEAAAIAVSMLAVVGVFMLGFMFGRFTIPAPANEGVPVEREAEPAAAVETVVTGEADAERTETNAETAELKAVEVIATAYCPCEYCTDGDGITATGTKATAGRTLAVDPSKIPYGTEVIINGITYIAEDCGGAIKGNKVDIFFDTHEEAQIFGVQTVTAYVRG